MPDGIRLVVDQ